MSRLADSFHNMSAAYMMKNRDAEFDDITAYVNAFADKLAMTDRVSQRLLKEQYGELRIMKLKLLCIWHSNVLVAVIILLFCCNANVTWGTQNTVYEFCYCPMFV